VIDIPPFLAYGENFYEYNTGGDMVVIPPGSVLEYELELLDFYLHEEVDTKGKVWRGEKYEVSRNGPQTPEEYDEVKVIIRSNDELVDSDQELTFVIGTEPKIDGRIELAIQSMRKGEKSQFFILSRPYNKKWAHPKTNRVEYTIKLIEITMGNLRLSNTAVSPIADKMKHANIFREIGNNFFKAGKVKRALRKYNHAAQCLENKLPKKDKDKIAKEKAEKKAKKFEEKQAAREAAMAAAKKEGREYKEEEEKEEEEEDEEEKRKREEAAKPDNEVDDDNRNGSLRQCKLAIRLNQAICSFKLEEYRDCIRDASLGIKLNKDHIKLLFKRAQANFKIDECDEASKDLNHILELLKANNESNKGETITISAVEKELTQVNARIAALKEKEKATFGGFLANNKVELVTDEDIAIIRQREKEEAEAARRAVEGDPNDDGPSPLGAAAIQRFNKMKNGGM